MKDRSGIENRTTLTQSNGSVKASDERLNRMNFFLRNISTSKTYTEAFFAIVSTYPLVQLGSTQNAQKIRYLCVAGTDRVVRYSVDDPTILDASMSPSDKRLSIHLCFDRRVNFKRKFLNDLFPGKYLNQSYHTLVFSFVELKLPDYLLTENADQFNTEIKSVSKGNVMESSVYMSKNKKEKKSSANGYNQQRDEIATDAFNQSSITSGWFISF